MCKGCVSPEAFRSSGKTKRWTQNVRARLSVEMCCCSAVTDELCQIKKVLYELGLGHFKSHLIQNDVKPVN